MTPVRPEMRAWMIGVAFSVLVVPTNTQAEQTILQRVLSKTPTLGGLFVNVAETAAPHLSGLPARIDGSIRTSLTGLAGTGNPDVAATAAPAFALNSAASTAFAAINAGETVIGVDADVTVGLPEPEAGVRRGGEAVAKALATLGASAAISGAGVGRDTAARMLTIVTPGGGSTPPLLVANLAASVTDVTGEVRSKIAGTSVRVGDAAATAGGVVNSGKVASGLNVLARDLEARITGTD